MEPSRYDKLKRIYGMNFKNTKNISKNTYRGLLAIKKLEKKKEESKQEQ